jgi:hypothetical protein
VFVVGSDGTMFQNFSASAFVVQRGEKNVLCSRKIKSDQDPLTLYCEGYFLQATRSAPSTPAKSLAVADRHASLTTLERKMS